MTRPTIRDLAEAAGVSISTANRVLAGAVGVRAPTVSLVHDAAERLGFYGLGTIRSQIKARRTKYRFGFLLLQASRTFYKSLAVAIETTARQIHDADVECEISFADDLSPQFVSAKLLELGQSCQAVAVVAAVHPMIAQAVETLKQKGVPVFALISQLSATGSINYVGLDNWKVGRTAAWAISNICKAPGKVGILVGNHRFRCQEMNESGFRSYFREFAPEFTLLEPLSTFETSAVAEEMTEKLLAEHPDLQGLFVAGGGISGAINALRSSGKSGQLTAVGFQLMENTRGGLLDGTLTVVISHPLEAMANGAIQGMIRASNSHDETGSQTIILPFDLFTRENI